MLKNCGLLKFFVVSYLKAQPDLLQYLVRAWDPNEGIFNIWGQELEIDATDIYFLTGLSWRGERPRIIGETIYMLIGRMCLEAQK